jgi:hypothetical protein
MTRSSPALPVKMNGGQYRMNENGPPIGGPFCWDSHSARHRAAQLTPST